MKHWLLFALLVTSFTGEAKDDPNSRIYFCEMKDFLARPYYRFKFVLDQKKNMAKAWTYEYPSRSSKAMPIKEVLLGFEEALVIEDESSVYIEGDGDGDAGYVSISKYGQTKLEANITFPEGPSIKVDNELVEMTCEQQQ